MNENEDIGAGEAFVVRVPRPTLQPGHVVAKLVENLVENFLK